MDNKNIKKLEELVMDSLKDENVKVFLFGSRARKDNYSVSDVDIGFIPKGSFNDKKITLLKDKIENSNIPYKVDLVNFNDVSEDFKNEALKAIIVWKDWI